MRLDELAMDARNVHLAQINAGAGVASKPIHHGHQVRPLLCQLDDLQGPFGQPFEHCRLFGARVCQHLCETVCVTALPRQGQCILEGVDPDRLRQALQTEDAMIELAPPDSDVRDRDKIGHP